MSLLISDLIKQKNAPTRVTSAQSVDVTSQNFEEVVLKGSLKKLILIDFWAPWCQPCKVLEPILEKVATAYAQQVVLAKVNIDAEPNIAMQFRIQSVPTVIAFHQGRPVDGFAGALPEAQIRTFVEKIIGPPAVDVPALLAQAKAHLHSTEFEQARALYETAWGHDPQSLMAVSGLVKSHAFLGNFEEARTILARAPAPTHTSEELKQAEQLIAYRAALQNTLAAAPPPPAEGEDALETQYFQAQKLFFQHQYLHCFEQLLHIIQEDMTWQNHKAKNTLMALFDLLGADHPLVIQSRKKLSALLCR